MAQIGLPPLAARILNAMRVEQQRYRFAQARALAAPLSNSGEAPELFGLQRDGLRLAQQLSLVEGRFQEAKRWGDELAALHARQSDPERRRWAHAEPLREWRLEFQASSDAAQRAAELLAKQSELALAPLLAELEREPQSTALAYALLLVLRRGGWLERPTGQPSVPSSDVKPETSGPIPRQLWLLRRHGTATPALEQRQARWQELHPGWQVQWLDHQEGAIEELAELPELVRQSCLCVGDAAVRGDLLRMALLWLHGGVAVDFGIAPRQSLEPLLGGLELLLLQDGFGGIDSGVWAAPPRHPWVETALVEACRNVLEAQGYSRWSLSGSRLLSSVTARWLRPQLAGQGSQLPGLAVLAAAEQGTWLQRGAAEPAPEGFVAPEPASLLNRRRCSWLQQRWGWGLPPLQLTTSWPGLAAAAGQPGLAPAELAAWVLQQPASEHSQRMENLLAFPPSWRELFTPQAVTAPPVTAEQPDLDAVQQAEAQRQNNLQHMSFNWLPLSGQFHHTLRAIRAEGRKAWIVEMGSHSGDSARWLAQRWPDAELLCFAWRQEDLPLLAHTLAGSRARLLPARPLAGDQLQLDAAGPGALRFPLDRLASYLDLAGGKPLLLHLDAGMEGFAELFAQSGGWLAGFPLVLLHGALLCDAQGRLLPQPHQQALAAAGFELVRSGEVLVAFQPHLLRPAPSQPAGVLATDLTALNGSLRQQGGVVAFDGEWQGPAITEQRACELALQRLGAHPDRVYVGFPWASLIDHLNNGTARGRALLAQLQALVPLLEGRQHRVTVCQQIFFEQHRWLFELAGITDLFWPHATIYSSIPRLTIHPFPLYPVHWKEPADPDASRDILYSFIGACSTPLYLSNSRDLILSSLKGLPGSWIEGYEGWYFDDHVYGVQIRGTLAADDDRVMGAERRRREKHYVEVLNRSLFAICPSGTGPNTIRLWEALGCGSIPVILSDRWRPPGPRQLWEAAALFVPDTPEGVLSVPRLTAQWSENPAWLASKRAAMAELWRRYGPEGFIGDLELLWRS